MRRITITSLVVGVLMTGFPFATTAAEEGDQAGAPLQGTWRIMSKNPDAPAVTLKHLTDTHFTWLSFKKDTMDVFRCGGGRYTVNGDKYTEFVEYGYGPNFAMVKGRKITFTWKVEGNKWYHSNNFINEVWERAGDSPLVASAPLSKDERQIRKNIAQLAEAINAKDADALGQFFLENMDHISPFAAVSKGREELAAAMRAAFQQMPNWKTTMEVLDVRFPKPDVAISISRWGMLQKPEGWTLPENGYEMTVWVKRDGQWKVICGRPMITGEFKAVDTLPTAAGHSKPELAKEVQNLLDDTGLDAIDHWEEAVMVHFSDMVLRGPEQIGMVMDFLEQGRKKLLVKVNSARSIAPGIIVADIGAADTGKWTLPNGTVFEGTGHLLISVVLHRENGKWTHLSSSVMRPAVLPQ